MTKRSLPIFILIIASLVVVTMLTGCVEVAPPSGQQNASAYGPVSSGGDMKDLVKGQNQTFGEQGTVTQGNQENQSINQGTGQPAPPLPGAENSSFVKVEPKNYAELTSDTPISYLPYNRPVVTSDREYVTIYEILNQSFTKNASAYAYYLNTPPLYVELGFYPKMVTDEQEVYKRTGDKEGTITYTKTRPSQDAWFEMRVYDLNTSQEILREGYGKTYSLTNKTAVIRRSGTLQFDFMGDSIAADITMKIPVDSETVANYSQVSTLIEGQKVKSGLLPAVFLGISDIGQDWQQTGELIHKPDEFSSIYIKPSSGSKLSQEIKKYSGNQDAVTAYAQTKKINAGETQASIIAGDEGYGFESVRKTGVVFRQGAYLIQLTSYSVPPVSLDELKRYATIISSRIHQA